MKRLLITPLLVLCMFSMAGAATLSRNETVYVSLSPTGTPLTTDIVTWLHTDGSAPVIDHADLDDVRNIKGKAFPTRKKSALSFDTTETDVFYGGTTNRELPVSVFINYALDGRPASFESLHGATGHLEVTVRFKNRTTVTTPMSLTSLDNATPRTVTREIPVPFMTLMSADLDIRHFSNVQGGDAMCIVVGATMKMNWMTLPSPEATLSFSADVRDLHMPSLTFTFLPLMPPLPEVDLASSLGELYDGLDQIDGALDNLTDGLREVNAGQRRIGTGLHELADGTGQLCALPAGQARMVDGAAQINSGIADGLKPIKGLPFARKAIAYLDIQHQLLELVSTGGSFSPDVQALFASQNENITVETMPGLDDTARHLAEIQNGTERLAGGVEEISGGTTRIADGLDRLRQEGIVGMKQGLADNTGELIEQLAMARRAKTLAENYDRFTGTPSAVPSKVQFIMKTPEA